MPVVFSCPVTSVRLDDTYRRFVGSDIQEGVPGVTFGLMWNIGERRSRPGDDRDDPGTRPTGATAAAVVKTSSRLALTKDDYSYRSASMGSRRDARRAG
jgi:hypothetical protein